MFTFYDDWSAIILPVYFFGLFEINVIMELSQDSLSLKIVRIFSSKIDAPFSESTLNKSIKNDLGINSLEMVHIIVMTEKLFHISIFDDECEKIKTVNDYIILVKMKIKEFKFDS